MGRAALACVVGLLATGPGALAQEGPSAWGPDRVWRVAGPVEGRPMSDLAVHPDDPSLRVAVALNGQAWLTADAGATWHGILSPIPVRLGDYSVDEDVLREVETRIEDLLDSSDDIDLQELLEDGEGLEALELDEDLADLVRQATDEVTEEVRGELRSNPEYVLDALTVEEQTRALEGALDAVAPQAWITPADQVLVGRADGLWLSEDLGATWRHVLEVSTGALARHGGLWVAGTLDGLRYSTDLVRWTDRDDGTEGARVLSLAAGAGGVYAGTEGGLWFAVDGSTWARLGAVQRPVWALYPDPARPGALWLAAGDGVLYLSSRDGDPEPAADPPTAPVVDLLEVEPGHLLAASTQGPWESVDDGRTWQQVQRGLSDPDARALALAGDEAWLAGDEGLMHLVVAAFEPLRPDEIDAVAAAWMPVDLLVGSALDRPGLTDPAPPSRLGATLLPRLRVEAGYRPQASLAYRRVNGTRRGVAHEVQALLLLEWEPEGRRTTAAVDALVVGGEVVLSDGSQRSLLAARVDRSAGTYRRALIEEVADLHSARTELVARQRRRAGPLAERVDRALDIQELEAQIDALTDGAVSRWRHTEEEP